jgi:hypothetical protein
MKTFTAFAVAAALLSSVSFASAQTTKGSMSNDATTRTGVSAGTNAQWCSDVRGSQNCKYTTQAACQKDAGANGTCIKNPKFGMKDNGMKSNAMEPKSGTTGSSASSPIKKESDSVKKQ